MDPKETILVYDWNEQRLYHTYPDDLRKDECRVIPIPRPSAIVTIYDNNQNIALRMNLSSHNYPVLYLVGMPSGFSDIQGGKYPPKVSHASSICSTSEIVSKAAGSHMSDVRDEMTKFIISLLAEDQSLGKPFQAAFRASTADKSFVVKLRSLLQTFAEDLGKEARSSTHEAMIGLIQTLSENIALELQKRYSPAVTEFDKPIEWISEEHSGPQEARQARVETTFQSKVKPQENSHAEEDSENKSHSPKKSKDRDYLKQLQAPQVSLGAFKAFVSYSTALMNLRDSFRCMVYPDTLEIIRKELTRIYPSSKDTYKATFIVRWDLDRYLDKEVGYHRELKTKGDILGSMLTVTGTGSASYASSAISYMQWKWGAKKSSWLLTNVDFWDQDQIRVRYDGIRTRLRWKKFTKKASTSAQFTVKGLRDFIIDFAQQLAWLAAVFRLPQYGQTSYSEVSFDKIGKAAGMEEFEIVPLAMRKVQTSSKACWLPLFENIVIARGFPIPERENGERGIELPYQLMVSQAGIIFSKAYKGGLFLRGLSTLIFPTASWADQRSVQWHMIWSGDFRTRLPPETIPPCSSENGETENGWMQCTNLEQLTSAPRTFLGYCKDITVHLATEDADISRVSYSRADDERHRPSLLLNSIAGGIPNMGILSGQVSMRLIRPTGLLRCSRHDTFPDLLDSARLRPILLYDDDPKAQKGWLVPTLSAVLHMVHVWARDKALVAQIPHIAAGWDAGNIAMHLIQRNQGLKLREESQGGYLCLRNVVEKLLISLEELIVDEALAKKEPDPTIKFESTKVYGWDLVDIANRAVRCRRKQLTIREPWTALSDEVLVLFCQGLGEVIRPAATSHLCSAWDPIPSQRRYLTATVQCLQELSLRRGRNITHQCLKLTDEAYWLCPSDSLFDDCRATDGSSSSSKEHKCLKVPQQISSSDRGTKIAADPPTQGAVVFGTTRSRKVELIGSAKRGIEQHLAPLISVNGNDDKRLLTLINDIFSRLKNRSESQ